MFVRCPFCHKRILRWFYGWHQRKHTERRPDGQMSEHITQAPQQRYQGSLAGVPQAYHHDRCGVTTRMPEEIIRSYLVDPLLYNDGSFCCGCGTYVFSGYLTWEETGEVVLDYMGRLRAEYLARAFKTSPAELVQRRVIVTPRAAGAIGKLAAEMKLPEPYYFFLGSSRAGLEVQYSVNLVPTWDPGREAQLESSGVRVVVEKRQLEDLFGTIVDYREGPEAGFQISRLHS
jgi:Fe-S cluster assembly iron-binding protein IscA